MNKLKFINLILVFFILNCSTVKKQEMTEKKPEIESDSPEPIAKYSTDPNFAPVSDREYKRMTRQKMEDESSLHAGAGSLWVMEGQTSYLFAQNKQRQAGDTTQIKIEGSALKQLEMKVSTIQDLLSELDLQKKQAELEQKKIEFENKKSEQEKIRLVEIEKEKDKIIIESDASKNIDDAQTQKLAEENVNKRMPALVEPPELTKAIDNTDKKKDAKPDLKDVDLIPSRIVEKTPEGMYRISGQQVLNIMKRPYKVIATGLVKPEDFDDQGINSSKILEPQYDVIHIKKTEKL